MDVSQKNRRNVNLRWIKKHAKDFEHIKRLSKSQNYLKARILGFLASDGNILFPNKKNKHYTVRFYPDHRSLIKPFQEAVKIVYNKEIKAKEMSNYYCITIDSKPMVLDITKSAKLGTHRWNVPLKFLKKEEEKVEWLRAFYDGDGYVNEKFIRINSVNQKGMDGIQKMLEEFNIQSKIYQYSPKNKNWNKVTILNIAAKEARKSFLKKVGFNHAIKLKKLKLSLS